MLVSLNKAAELLETDRGVMARAARSVRPVDISAKRQLFRLADLSAALERHRQKPDQRRREYRDAPSALLQKMFDEYERLDDAVARCENGGCGTQAPSRVAGASGRVGSRNASRFDGVRRAQRNLSGRIIQARGTGVAATARRIDAR
jgi:hypothetical protein